jgi:hypothetical protein
MNYYLVNYKVDSEPTDKAIRFTSAMHENRLNILITECEVKSLLISVFPTRK